MPKTSTVLRVAAASCLLAAACWFLSPARLRAQTTDGPGVTVDTGGALLMHRSAVTYPAAALSEHIQGTVVVQATLDAAGNVADARVLSGPEELRRVALQSVLQWHFARETAGATRQVRITFQTPAPNAGARAVEVMQMPLAGPLSPGVVSARKGSPANILPEQLKVRSVTVYGLPEQIKGQLLSALPVHEGDVFTRELLASVSSAARQFDEHLTVSSGTSPSGEVDVRITAPGSTFVTTSSVPAAGLPALHVDANDQASKIVRKVAPLYPDLAKQARIQGSVNLNVAIGKDGAVQQVVAISGHPLLLPAAIEAVKQWTYQPTLLNGQPVDVSTSVTVNFTLAD